MYNVSLANYGMVDVKRASHESEVAEGLHSFGDGPFGAEDVNVYMWRYRVYSELPYVTKLCTFTAEDLAPWRGRYMVHSDVLCWGRALIVAQFGYMSRAD